MLVFVSDLHIGDHTTGVQHLDFRAFAEALPNIGRQAQENGSNQVTFVFLGDIFDLVRTREWTNLESGRPWDTMPNPDRNSPSPMPDEATRANAVQLLTNIIWHPGNRDIFDVWRNPLVTRYYYRDDDEHSQLRPATFDPASEAHLPETARSKRLWPCDVEPRRVYVPGNHDRMINQLPELRELVIECLGLNRGAPSPLSALDAFDHYYRDDNYRVWARHGQEWDAINFEYADQWKPDVLTMEPWKFQEICIGEIIAAEIASRLPDELARQLRKLDNPPWPEKDIEIAVENIKTLDDVRPMTAILSWLINKIEVNAVGRQNEQLHEALTATIQEVARYIRTLKFVRAWAKKHNKLPQYWAIMLVAPRLKATTLDRLMRLFEGEVWKLVTLLGRLDPWATPALPNDNYASAALADLRRAQATELPQTLYVLYGHNHLADQVPLEGAARLDELAKKEALTKKELREKNTGCSVYLNTGTWRPLVRQALARDGFMRWKNLTYSIFYCHAHDPGSKAGQRPKADGFLGDPTFEVWTGALLSPHRPEADALEKMQSRRSTDAKPRSEREAPWVPLHNGCILPTATTRKAGPSLAPGPPRKSEKKPASRAQKRLSILRRVLRLR